MTPFYKSCNSTYRLRYWNCITDDVLGWLEVATVLTVYGIETIKNNVVKSISTLNVATVLTVYGIETWAGVKPAFKFFSCNSTYRLRYWNLVADLAQPLTVAVATVLTVYGIETMTTFKTNEFAFARCNSTYRLRYWNYHILLLS